MKRAFALFETYYLRVRNSIAFWPTLIGTAFSALAVFMREFGGEAFFRAVDEVLPFLLIRDREVSLSLLTTFIGGLISLMVFSFSMVMVLLSNATSNLSPRLLPSLIGRGRHQVVLGFYLGTILYATIIAMGFGLSTEDGQPPSTSVALAVLFAIVCLGLFISFIHGVSLSIQVNEVMRDSHARSVRAIEEILGRHDERPPAPSVTDWSVLEAPTAGFFQGIDGKAAAAFAKTHDARLVVTAVRGRHVLPGDELLRVERGECLRGDAGKELRGYLVYDETGRSERYYGHGIEHLVEVAQKAMSPGINDPGTACTSIDYLKHLFTLTMPVGDHERLSDSEGTFRVWIGVEPWAEMLGRHFDNLYVYCEESPSAVASLLRMLDALLVRLNPEDGERVRIVERLRRRARESEVAPGGYPVT